MFVKATLVAKLAAAWWRKAHGDYEMLGRSFAQTRPQAVFSRNCLR